MRTANLSWPMTIGLTAFCLLPFFLNINLFPFMRMGMFSWVNTDKKQFRYHLLVMAASKNRYQEVSPEELGLKDTYLEVWLTKVQDKPPMIQKLLQEIKAASIMPIDSIQLEITSDEGKLSYVE